jgi:hypothetical protein
LGVLIPTAFSKSQVFNISGADGPDGQLLCTTVRHYERIECVHNVGVIHSAWPTGSPAPEILNTKATSLQHRQAPAAEASDDDAADEAAVADGGGSDEDPPADNALLNELQGIGLVFFVVLCIASLLMWFHVFHLLYV